jgi:hypothetical protein
MQNVFINYPTKRNEFLFIGLPYGDSRMVLEALCSTTFPYWSVSVKHISVSGFAKLLRRITRACGIYPGNSPENMECAKDSRVLRLWRLRGLTSNPSSLHLPVRRLHRINAKQRPKSYENARYMQFFLQIMIIIHLSHPQKRLLSSSKSYMVDIEYRTLRASNQDLGAIIKALFCPSNTTYCVLKKTSP